jgi:5-formyltetrahydrofolate cyclo-ligase
MTVGIGSEGARLRERSRQVRDAIDPARRLASSGAIHERLYELSRFRDAAAIAIYFSTGSEVMTGALAVRLAEEEGKRIFLPFVLNDALQLTEWRPSDPVVDAPYGGMHPRYRRAVPLEEVDAIVVTGLCFDRAGGRLGEEAGHADYLLRRLPLRTARLGVAFSEQLVQEMSSQPGDRCVQAIVTDAEVIVCDPAFEPSAAR